MHVTALTRGCRTFRTSEARRSTGSTPQATRSPVLLRNSHVSCAAVCQDSTTQQKGAGVLRDVCLSKAGAAALSCALMLSQVQPAHADLAVVQQQEAPAATLTSLAKPLPKQKVEKGRVWGVLIGGAIVLFTGTLVVENLEAFFPAIARANKAMALSRKKIEQQERRESQAVQEEAQATVVQQQSTQSMPEQQSLSAVEAGMAEARQKMLQAQAASTQTQEAAPPTPSTSFPSQLDSGVAGGSSTTAASSSSSSDSSSSQNDDDDGPPSSGGSSDASSNGSPSRALTNEEINAARMMSVRQGEGDQAELSSRPAAASTSAAALQEPSSADESAAAAAAAVAVAVGSSVSKTARLESFVGGVMREGNQAGFLSAMKGGRGSLPRS